MKYTLLLIFVCFSLVCIGSFYFGFSYYDKKEFIKIPIKFIAQTGPIKEGLQTDYLAEILDLSIDHPKYLGCGEVKKILKKNPLIKKVSVSYLNPETLYIDYTLRNPVFVLADLENTAVDLEGHLFPLSPYFTPKTLPRLYLGVKEMISFDQPLKERAMALAIDILTLLKEEVRQIDLSGIDEDSLGKREIVLILEAFDEVTHTLRLSPKRYKEELNNYQKLKRTIQDQEMIVDLRIPEIAYLNPITKKIN